ncbi:MAG: metallophosphoesterase [Clostridia bacterium]|nr:metallophosphoesterase [Clostridia bacterium]
MTRIGVISDTHGSRSAIDACVFAAGAVDGWFHLGDCASDAKYLREKTGLPVYTVFGNCDGASFTSVSELVFPNEQKLVTAEAVIRVENARIFLCHGHTYDVDLAPYTLSYRAEELNCAAALYGHTHIGELSAFGRLLLMNPGSPSRPRAGRKPSFAVLEVDGADVNGSIKTI